MLDVKKVGLKIASLRKEKGYSQEKLADILYISPQAISKWENGHTLPETSLLPVLAQIFNCSIDDIIMPGYILEEKIEAQKDTTLDKQAEQIASQVLRKIEDKMMERKTQGLSNDTIIRAVYKANGYVGLCKVNRKTWNKVDGNTITSMAVTAPQRQFELLEKQYSGNDCELYRYGFLQQYLNSISQIYHIDFEQKIVLKEDLNNCYIQGAAYDEDNENGVVIRKKYYEILKAVAKWHATFWENDRAFGEIGLDWRLQSKENLMAHISTMENDFETYRKNEESGKIPKVWQGKENHIELDKLKYFADAVQRLKHEYVQLLETRFYTGDNITIIHGDMHPGTIYVAKDKYTVKFDGLQAVRMGIGTEDLAMLIALHIAPDKKNAMTLLDYYYKVLCETINNYSYETFLHDYKISIMENMFFTIKLMNNGIFDFHMRDKALKAFETFVAE